MTTPTVPEVYELRPGETEVLSVDYGTRLIGSELLSGTPTITASSTLLTLANKAYNSADVTIGAVTMEANTGAQCSAAVSTGITSPAKYYVTFTGATSGSPARTLIEIVTVEVVV